ncbi:tetratricopeptide repeat protein [Thiolapillus sp.]
MKRKIPLHFALLLAVSMGLNGNPVSAHSGIHERIEHTTDLIRQKPDDPQLYIDRAFLYGEHHEWKAALDDIQQAEKLAHGPIHTDYAHALLLWQQYLDRHSPAALKKALEYGNRAVAQQPSNSNTRLLRARMLRASGATAKALSDYEAAIASATKPHADLYSEAAELWVQTGHYQKALQVLEASVTQMGEATVPVIRMAMRIASENHLPETALHWWERLPDVLKVLPNELLQKGDLLARSGNEKAARQAYCEAEKQLKKLPAWRRQKPNLRNVGNDLKSRLQHSCD